MILAFDTYYVHNQAKTVCIAFEHWTDERPMHVYSQTTAVASDYEPGQFYKRELPCILSLLHTLDLAEVDVIIVDGYVVLDDEGQPGLGGHLFEALGRKIPVVGVAKTNFARNNRLKAAVLRGSSKKPLFVSAMGMDLQMAAEKIRSMHGVFRMPALLKGLDGETKQLGGANPESSSK